MICYLSYAISEPYNLGALTFERHRQSVEFLAAEISRAGFSVILPAALPGISHRMAMIRDHELLHRSDVVFVHQSEWTATSKGVRRETHWARELGIPVVRSIEELRALRLRSRKSDRSG